MQTREPKIPGIYLQDIAPTPAPDLLTGVPVFLGLAKSKSASCEMKPRKLTLAIQFEHYFFVSLQDNKGYLHDAITGFFVNGGSLCYIIPLADNTLETLQLGLEASEVLEDTDLVCVPDIMLLESEADIIKRQQAVLAHCDRMGDRLAILDGINDVTQLDQQRQALSSNNGALYAPWLKIENPLPDDNKPKSIPPCGHIAGTYASSDRTVGVHGAPANIPLEGILDLSFSLTPEQQYQLNPQNQPGVNCIRSLRGRGIRVWGVRTLSSQAEWQYVNVRRLFGTFGRWANLNLADTVFEPNDVLLRLRLTRELTVYCESLWSQGALQGGVPQEGFYVKCDEETNPPEKREMGQVVAEVGLAPAIPGEFIQVFLVLDSSGGFRI